MPPRKDEITWVYTENDSLATGVIQALEEAGKKPGVDVLVVGGTCHGDTTDLLEQKLVGTGVQAAFLEGWQSVQTLHKYLKTGEVKDGKLQLNQTAKPPWKQQHRLKLLQNSHGLKDAGATWLVMMKLIGPCATIALNIWCMHKGSLLILHTQKWFLSNCCNAGVCEFHNEC